MEDIKGPSVLDRAKDEVVAVTGTVHDALHSVKKETEEKAEKLKGGLRHLLHKGPQLYGRAKEEIKGHLLQKNGEGNGEISSPVEASIPVQVLGTKQEGIGEGNGEISQPMKTSIPVQVLGTKQEGIGEGNGEISQPMKTSIPVQVLGTKQEGIGEGNGEISQPMKTSIPVQVLGTKQEGIGEGNGEISQPMKTSIPVQVLDTKKEGENNFVAFFARIFEKFCEPFNKKKD